MANLVDQMSSAESTKDVYAMGQKMLKELQEQISDNCLQCVKCTAGCPAMKLLELHPHEIMALMNLGFTDELLKSEHIWNCVTCFKCKERCPQKVAPADAILLLRSLAVLQGLPLPKGFAGVLQALMDKGIIQEPVEVMDKNVQTNKKKFTDRKKLGLPDASRPKDLEKFKEAFMNALQQTLSEG